MTPTIVAEIGCNHRGELSTALRMIEIVAGYCREHFQLDGTRAKVVAKFQKRTPSAYPEWYSQPHPNPANSYGATYGEHRDALEFTAAEHYQLLRACGEQGIGYACSVWDEQAADDITAVGGAWLKIPSARNLDWPLLDHAYSEWAGEIHVSVGMLARSEIQELVSYLARKGWAERTVLYACTSGYPVPFTDVRLGEIDWLKRAYEGVVRSIGFSGHHHGIAVDMAAVALGASHIERHFTLNRTWKGTDHAASLEPDGLRKLIRDAQAVQSAMGEKDGVLPIEIPQREKLTREVAV